MSDDPVRTGKKVDDGIETKGVLSAKRRLSMARRHLSLSLWEKDGQNGLLVLKKKGLRFIGLRCRIST